MLRYTNWGAKSIAVLSLALVVASVFAPFLEMGAFTPLYAFIHRFSITLEIGSFSKTLQPVFFVIPALFVRSIFEYHKRFHLRELLKTPIVKVLGGLLLLDIISTLTSTSITFSVAALISHAMNYAVFATMSIWMYLVSTMLEKQHLKDVGVKLLTTFSIALIVFSSVNALVSVTQFLDCSTTSTGCHVWKAIDETFPNKLLTVGHQKFSYKPIVIRAPGFFGDVNFNGMFGLFIALLSAFAFVTWEIMKKEKGYIPQKEQRVALIGIVTGLISFILNLSRSALLATGVLGILLLGFYAIPLIKSVGIPKELLKKSMLFLVAGLVGLLLLFGLGFAVPLSHGEQKTSLSREITRYVVEMFSPEEDSAQGHASLFASAVSIGKRYPVTGTGIGTFSQKYAELIDPSNPNVSPHSTYGLIFAEQGIIGIIGFLCILGYIWVSAFRLLVRTREQIILSIRETKRTTREYFFANGVLVLLAFSALALPYFSIATITYYGFFLPMVWWWGNIALLEK